MSNKTRSVLKIIAVVFVAVAVMTHIGWLAVPYIRAYHFWLVVSGFCLLLVSSK